MIFVQKLLGALSVALAILAVVSFGWILYQKEPWVLDLGPAGWSNFFFLYDGPIKALAAAIATSTLWMAVRRLSQDGDNNRFLNYFRHREELRKHIEADPQLHCWVEKAGQLNVNWSNEIYREFFYPNHHSFVPRISEHGRRLLEYLQRVASSPLNKADQFRIESLNQDMLERLNSTVPDSIRIPAMKCAQVQGRKPENTGKWLYFCTIYQSVLLYSSVAAFAGETTPDLGALNSNYSVLTHP